MQTKPIAVIESSNFSIIDRRLVSTDAIDKMVSAKERIAKAIAESWNEQLENMAFFEGYENAFEKEFVYTTDQLLAELRELISESFGQVEVVGSFTPFPNYQRWIGEPLLSPVSIDGSFS